MPILETKLFQYVLKENDGVKEKGVIIVIKTGRVAKESQNNN